MLFNDSVSYKDWVVSMIDEPRASIEYGWNDTEREKPSRGKPDPVPLSPFQRGLTWNRTCASG